jgi:hypothetical protein
MGKSNGPEQDFQEIQSLGFTKQLIQVLRYVKERNSCTYLNAMLSKTLSECEIFADVM